MSAGDNESGAGGRRNTLLGLQRFLAIQLPDDAAPKPLVSYDDALIIGQKLAQRWPIFTGRPAPQLDAHGWADIVLFVLRSAWDGTDGTPR